MRKLLALTSVVVSLGALAPLACEPGKAGQGGSPPDTDKEETALSTKEIMTRAHKGKQSPVSRLRADLQKAAPDWPRDEAYVVEMIRLVSGLSAQKPPQGSQEAWNTRVRAYLDNAKEIQRNLKEQNLQAARASVSKLLERCKDCHDAHNPH